MEISQLLEYFPNLSNENQKPKVHFDLREWTMTIDQHGSESSDPEQVGLSSRQATETGAGHKPGKSLQSAALSLPPNRMRWVPHRKAEVVEAVRGGLLSLDEARERYALSIEEFLAWQHKATLFGLAGLRVYGTQGRERMRPQPDDVRSKARARRKPTPSPAKSE